MRVQPPVRVVQFVGSMVRGGIETWLMHMLRAIDRQQYQIDIVVKDPHPAAYDDEVRALGSRIFVCERSKILTYEHTLRQILQTHGPYHIAQSHMAFFSGYILKIAQEMGIPQRLAHYHPSGYPQRGKFDNPLTDWLFLRMLRRHATHLVAPSQNSLRFIRSVSRANHLPATQVTNCIDLHAFAQPVDRVRVRRQHNLPTDLPLIVYVARFYPHKNHRQLLRVADQLNRDHLRAHFVLVGSHGPLLAALQEHIRSRTDVTLLLGLEEVAPLLLAADLFFFPSVDEGFGIVAIEAQAARLPVIATDLPAIREACAPELHPLLFQPDDDITAVAQLQRLLSDQLFYEQIATACHTWSQRFSVASSLNALLTVYNQKPATEHYKARTR